MAVPVRNQPRLADRPPSFPGEQELTGLAEGGDSVHDGLRVGDVTFGGTACVGHIGDFACAEVDSREARGSGHVRPDPRAVPGEIVQPAYPLALAADMHDGTRFQRAGVTAYELAGAVTRHDLAASTVPGTGPGHAARPDRAHPPPLAVVANPVAQLERGRIPAQCDPLLPGQLPDAVPCPADSLAEDLGRQQRPRRRLAPPEPVSSQRGLPVEPGGFPDRVPVGDQPLGESAPWMRHPPHDLNPVEPHTTIIQPPECGRGLSGRRRQEPIRSVPFRVRH